MRAMKTFGGLGTGLLFLSAHILFGGCEREVPQLDESFALCGVRSDELKESTLIAPWNDSGFQPSDGRDTELHLIGIPSHSGASVVTPRGCLVVPKLRPFVLVHLRESGRGFVLSSSALDGRPRLTRATLAPIADVPLARRCGLVETADSSAWLSLTTREGRPLLADDLTFESLDAAPGKSAKGDAKGTAQSALIPKRVAPLGCVARSEFSAAAPRLVMQKSTRLMAYLGLQESNTASLRVESTLGSEFFRSCRVNPDEDVRTTLSQTLAGKADANGRPQLLSVRGAAPADIVTANFSVCTTAGSSEGCSQSAWLDIGRAAGTGLRRVGACILAPPGDGRALSSLRVAMQDGRAFFAFLEKSSAKATSIAPLQVMEIPSAARFRETVRFEIGRCLADAAGRVRNVHGKQAFEARLAGSEVVGIAGSFVPSKLIWTAHGSNGTTRQVAFPLNEPFGALPFESIGFPFDTTSSSEWVDARLEVRFPSGETIFLEEAGGCRLSPWRASVAKVDVAERDLGVMARGSARTLEELGIDRTAPGLNDERTRYAYSFGPAAPDSGERWFADGASCLAQEGWKEVRDGVVSFVTPGRFGLSIRACNPAGGSAAPWTFRATVSSAVPDFELAWIAPLQLAPVPTIGSFQAPVPFEVRDLRDDVLPWNDLAASASCQVFIIDGSPVNKTSLSCSLEPDSRLRVLKGHVKLTTQNDDDFSVESFNGRRLRVVVRVGTNEVDRRERFLEAEIPPYVLNGYVPVVDALPAAAQRMQICGTVRTDNGTQYAVMADGKILQTILGAEKWEPFATINGPIERAFTPSRENRTVCDPMDLTLGRNNNLFITPVLPARAPNINETQLMECSYTTGCSLLFQKFAPEHSLDLLVRNDETFAALSSLVSSGPTTHRLFVRNSARDEYEIPIPHDIGNEETVLQSGLYFQSERSLVLRLFGHSKIYDLDTKVWSDLPSRLTDGGWQNCKTWPSAIGSVCSLRGAIRTLINDNVVEFNVPDIHQMAGEDWYMDAVFLETDGIFVVARIGDDLYVSRFDGMGRFNWRRRLINRHWNRDVGVPTVPLMTEILDGKFVFLNNRCQGFSIDGDSREQTLVPPFGGTLDRPCARPYIRGKKLIFHSPRYGLLKAGHKEAITWIEVSSNFEDYRVVSSKFRLLRISEGRDTGGMVKIETFDERSFSLTLPTECRHPEFENLVSCSAKLDNLPWLTKESKEFVFYRSPEALANRVERNQNRFGSAIFMNGRYVEIAYRDELIFAAHNGVLIRTGEGRLVFVRVGTGGELVPKDITQLSPPWKNLDPNSELETAALGRVAIVCGKNLKLDSCIVWTRDGLLGDDGVLGSGFDADTAKLKLIRFVDVAGWEGINATVTSEHGISMGNFVFNDQGRLRLVERLAVTGDPSHFQELLDGNLMAVDDNVFSIVSDGIWEMTPQNRPRKRVQKRTSAVPFPSYKDDSFTALIQNAFEPSSEVGVGIIVLPHFAYE